MAYPARARRPVDLVCTLCKTVDVAELVRLDLTIGDPARWPRTLWQEHGWSPPKGLLPPHYRAWGAQAIARDWLNRHGYEDIGDSTIRTHLRHVAKVARRPAELADTGLIAGEPMTKGIPSMRSIDPNAYLAYYAKGVALGLRGLALLEKRIDDMEARKVEVPLDLIKMLVEAGSKLSTSQAQIKSRGVKLHEDNDDDAFRRAASPEVDGEVTRIGHNRIRTVEGEARPIPDGGRGDRADYNKRAENEGLPGLIT
jgi:hypothetical protein